MATRPDLKLRDGLQKVRDYRVVHREELSVCARVAILSSDGFVRQF